MQHVELRRRVQIGLHKGEARNALARAVFLNRLGEFRDGVAGEQAFRLGQTCGDFVVYKNDGLAAYQLAVVVDDAEAGVDAIVRGDDLLARLRLRPTRHGVARIGVFGGPG
jgi:glutamyl/glutaminyl-tRNA synthetase